MLNKIWTVLAVLAGAFPFLTLGYKMFENSTLAGVIYSVIALILFGSLAFVWRTNITLPADAVAASPARPARPPAPPVRWDWDGIDRQPEWERPNDDDEVLRG